MNKPSRNTSGSTNSENIKIESFSVDKVTQLKSGSVAFDLTLNGVKIYGCFVIESSKGDFISLPQRKGNDGKYYSIVWARFSNEDSKAILAEVERILNN